MQKLQELKLQSKSSTVEGMQSILTTALPLCSAVAVVSRLGYARLPVEPRRTPSACKRLALRRPGKRLPLYRIDL